MSLDLKVYASLIGKRHFKSNFLYMNIFNFKLQKSVEFRHFVPKFLVKLGVQPFAQLCSSTTKGSAKQLSQAEMLSEHLNAPGTCLHSTPNPRVQDGKARGVCRPLEGI